MSWTTAADIRAFVLRRWAQGNLLVPAAEQTFPWHVRCSRPTTRDLSDKFDEVRTWIRALYESSAEQTGAGYTIDWVEVRHRQLGANRIPGGVAIPTLDDALALIGKRKEYERFQKLSALTEARIPQLSSWLVRRPLAALEHVNIWERLLMVVQWFCAHPRPEIYVRQIDLPGIDTKFVEDNRNLLAELLDAALPTACVNPAATPRQFELRYGLRPKPSLVRFRILDPGMALQGLTDIATPAAEFARLNLPVKRVFITENEINGLCFPAFSESLVIFGLGFGLSRLSECQWLHHKSVVYWGDIDTHGFAMLDRLRAILPQVQSLLMDEETLMLHQAHWVTEPQPHVGVLSRLTDVEQALYTGLSTQRFGINVRLEQERIGYGWMQTRL